MSQTILSYFTSFKYCLFSLDEFTGNEHELYITEYFPYGLMLSFNELIVLVSAVAFDNPSVAICMFLYFMATNPEVEQKLLSELAKHDDPLDCEYLEWCIKESMRLFTTVGLIGRIMESDKPLVDSDGTEYHVPKGTHCFVSVESLHHDEAYWHEARKFRPERFDPQSDEYKNRDMFAYLPFGYGRMCMGKSLVMKQMKLVLSMALKEFRFEVDTSKMSDKFEELEFDHLLTQYPQNGIHFRCFPRESKS